MNPVMVVPDCVNVMTIRLGTFRTMVPPGSVIKKSAFAANVPVKVLMVTAVCWVAESLPSLTVSRTVNVPAAV